MLLVEREDFCAGASQASSRLMHGGLKYLETGEFRLVRESLLERNMLLATAPHVVHPLECLVPVRSTWGGLLGSAARFFGIEARLNDRGLAVTALGLRLYDLYARAWRALPTSRMLGRRALQRLMPDLHPAITGGGLYWEGHITHAEVLGADGDVLTIRAEGRDRRVRAGVVVNAGGAWIDRVNAALGLSTRLMGGSKGSHLVVENPRLLEALGGRMVYFGTPDGRVNLVYPFAGRVLVGSTDIAQADLDAAACDEAEAAYLRAAVAEVFPTIPITEDQVVARFCGVRPLPRAEGADVGAVSRDHFITALVLPGTSVPVLCLIGGKWTTFRAFSAQAADRVLAHLGRPRRNSTEGLAIGGGRGFPRDAAGRARMVADLARQGGIAPERAEVLLDRYGTRAEAYVRTLEDRGETSPALVPGYAREEMAHLVRTERARSVEDLLRRRTLVALTGLDTPSAREAVAAALPTLDP